MLCLCFEKEVRPRGEVANTSVCLPTGDVPKGHLSYGRCPEGTQNSNMYCVYILKSEKNSDIYIGSTENLEKRFKLHNDGEVRSTKAYRPWIILEFQTCGSRSKAVQLERFLKTGQQKEILKRKYGHVVK